MFLLHYVSIELLSSYLYTDNFCSLKQTKRNQKPHKRNVVLTIRSQYVLHKLQPTINKYVGIVKKEKKKLCRVTTLFPLAIYTHTRKKQTYIILL